MGVGARQASFEYCRVVAAQPLLIQEPVKSVHGCIFSRANVYKNACSVRSPAYVGGQLMVARCSAIISEASHSCHGNAALWLPASRRLTTWCCSSLPDSLCFTASLLPRVRFLSLCWWSGGLDGLAELRWPHRLGGGNRSGRTTRGQRMAVIRGETLKTRGSGNG